MLKALRYSFLAVLGLGLLAVASANRAPVMLRLLPEEFDPFLGRAWVVELPLFLVIFAGILAGLLIGFVWEWFREAGIRAEASQHRRRVGHLEREVSRLKEQKGEGKDEVLALLDGR
jgi:uncharacterized integral membrane protein